MIEQENIVKRVCRELGINQAELASMLDVSTHVVSKWNTTSIPKMAEMALELILENKAQKKHLININNFYQSMIEIENFQQKNKD